MYLESTSKDAAERTQKELIMVSISYGYVKVNPKGVKRYDPCRIALEAKILPEHFGKREKNYTYDPGVFEKYAKFNKSISNKFNRLKIAVDDLELKYNSEERIPTPDEFGEDLKLKLKRRREIDTAHVTVLEFLKKDISKYEIGGGRNAVDAIGSNTIKTYRTLVTLLEEYHISTGVILFCKDLNWDRYWDIWDVCDEILRGVRTVDNPNRHKKQTKKKYGYSVNSIRKYQDALVKTMRRAKGAGINVPLDTTLENLKVPGADSSKEIFVSEEELKLIINSDVSYETSLQLAKDFILISSLTGMRYQSMVDTKSQEIMHCSEKDYDVDGKVVKTYDFNYILSRQEKTKTEVYMPLLKPVQDILEGYDGCFPKWPANGTINKKLKELFELLGFDTLCKETIVTYKFGEVVTMKPKYQLITAHDGRKSFLTNLDILKVDPDVADNMTHPDKKPKNAMRKVYVKTNSMVKSKWFVDEIKRVSSDVYCI